PPPRAGGAAGGGLEGGVAAAGEVAVVRLVRKAAAAVLEIGGEGEDGRIDALGLGQEEVGGEVDAVRHRDHDVPDGSNRVAGLLSHRGAHPLSSPAPECRAALSASASTSATPLPTRAALSVRDPDVSTHPPGRVRAGPLSKPA